MHTRSQSLGLASPPPSSPPQPSTNDIQKTKSSPTASETTAQHIREISAVTDQVATSSAHVTAPTTPKRGSKRVRFSDPGPQSPGRTRKGSSSGLTPSLRRSTLSPNAVRRGAQSNTNRKRKLPASFLQTPESSPASCVEVHQFTPLRQALDDRTKRRLKRNHLSEETNDWDHEHREDSKARRLATQLRDDCAKKEEQIKSLTLELELQRQRGIEWNTQDENGLESLHAELAEAKKKLALQDRQLGEKAPSEPDFEMLDLPDTGNEYWDDEPLVSSPSARPERLVTTSTSPTVSLAEQHPEQGCQASIPDPVHEAQLAKLLETIQSLEHNHSDAQAALAIIQDELHNLGFASTDDANAEDLINAIHEGFRLARLELERILPGETEGNLSNGKALLHSLLHHVKTLHQKSQASDKAANSHHSAEVALRRQFNAALMKLAELEQSIAEIMQHRTELISQSETKQQEIDALHDELRLRDIATDGTAMRQAESETALEESRVSIERLQGALKTYQDEARVLEALVAQLEEDKENSNAALADTITATEERVQDLEAQHRAAVTDYEHRLAQLQQDLIRAEDEVTVDREKLCREKSAFEARTKEMQVQEAELQDKLNKATEEVDELTRAGEEQGAELEKLKGRFAGHGRRVGDILEELSKEYKKSWAAEVDMMGSM